MNTIILTSVFNYWKPLSFGLIILILCLFPAESLQKIDFLNISFRDLIAHFIMFFIFSFLLTRDFKKNKTFNNRKSRQVILLLLICVLFAAFTEFLQFAFTFLHRSANLGDLLFDIAGTMAGFWTASFIK